MGIEPTVRQTCARHDLFNAHARSAAGTERRRSGLHDPSARSGLVIRGPRHQSSPLKDVYEHKVYQIPRWLGPWILAAFEQPAGRDGLNGNSSTSCLARW